MKDEDEIKEKYNFLTGICVHHSIDTGRIDGIINALAWVLGVKDELEIGGLDEQKSWEIKKRYNGKTF